MSEQNTLLERQIREALLARAITVGRLENDALDIVPMAVLEPVRHRRNTARLAVAACAAVLVLGLVGGFLASGSSGDHSSPSAHAGTGHASPVAAPTGDTRTSDLVAADSPDVQHLEEVVARGPLVQGTSPVAVQISGRAPVIFNLEYAYHFDGSLFDAPGGCITVVAEGIYNDAKYCSAAGGAADSLLVTSADLKTFYFGWAQVPAGTSSVVFDFGGTRVSQTPLDGVAYQAMDTTASQLSAAPPVATAYDKQGNVLGTAKVDDLQLRTYATQ